MSSAYALYRLPYSNHYVRVEGETREFFSYAQLNRQTGFVVAPFEVKDGQPIVLIHPEKTTLVACEASSGKSLSFPHFAGSPSLSYHIDFANFHAQLLKGTFRKIVLARSANEPICENTSPEQLFLCACRLYPRMFIALVHTSQTGIWLTATPEILLEGHGHDWRTIALAGTMRLTDSQLSGEGETAKWSPKNIEEQRIVATYIAECLEQFTSDFHEEGPRTVRAANLVHLRSDFSFTLTDNNHIGDLLQALHPTPAVCGLPKRESFHFIVHNEFTPRRYYSGFMGMLDPAAETRLYVSLRCMNITPDHYCLYAGGGLLKDSTEEQEWQETEAKLETMRRCIATNRMSTN